MNTKSIALIGDSLSTGFYLSGALSTIYRARRKQPQNWFEGTGSLCEHISQKNSGQSQYRIRSFAKASARANDTRPYGLADFVLGVDHASSQFRKLKKHLSNDNLILVWIGHNNLDWYSEGVRLKEDRQERILLSITNEIENSLRKELGEIATCSGERDIRLRIVLYGLINFEFFFEARSIAEQTKLRSPKSYPFLDRCYDFFQSMKPEHRDGMVKLSRMINNRYKCIVNEITSEFREVCDGSIRYSTALHDTDITVADSLSQSDAWHPSILGHRLLAKSAIEDFESHENE